MHEVRRRWAPGNAGAPGWRALPLTIALAATVESTALGQTSTEALKRMSLEDLTKIEVSTVSRNPEPTSEVPAAVFVLTRDDIRRSGATTLPEVLRLAPGVHVARIDASRYSIGIRGFADRLSRSMLVLMDGRAVYSPLFAGTYWEVQDTLLQDIERIEVIRGPGGTLWGANAVNGIINIVTRNAADTQGLLVTADAGSNPRGLAGIRFGGVAGANGRYRAYVKAFRRDAEFHPDGTDYDDWTGGQGGFRADWTLARSRALTIQGDAYAVSLGQRATVTTSTPPFADTVIRRAPLAGGNALARWSGPVGRRGSFQLQTYYDRTHRDEIPVAETRDTFDVDFQHRRPLWARHDLVWGVGYRITDGRITSVAPTRFLPESRADRLYSAFVQDEVEIVPRRLRLMVGAKVEHNDYSGVELQPSGRIAMTINPTNTLVWSVTRAVRTPSRVETDYTTESVANPAVPAFVRLRPNEAFESEKVTAYEMGYRVRPATSLYVTFSGFFNDLDQTLSTELLTPFVETSPAPPRLVLPVTFDNGLHGNSHGFELTGDARPASWWRLTANYSYLRVQMSRNRGSTDVSQERRYEGLSPRHQLQIQSSLDLPGRIALDWRLRYASDLPAGRVPSYATSNVRLAWPMTPELELAVVGQDLHEPRHVEWAGSTVEIRRSWYVGFTWRR
jgi:iron complex outermembrane receptor protein